MRERILLLVATVVLGGALLAGCGSSAKSAGPGAGTVTDSSSTAGCTTTAPPGAGAKKPSFPRAQQILSPKKRYAVVMRTSCGAIRVVLDPAVGGPIPNSVAFLATKRFYDGLTFHRVVPDFVLQGGDPNGDGSGGPGYSVRGPVPAGYAYKLGDVAMAKTATEPPGTAGSQFFVISGAQGVSLRREYGVAGHAADAASLATIRRIAALAVSDGPPSQPVYIDSARLVTIGG